MEKTQEQNKWADQVVSLRKQLFQRIREILNEKVNKEHVLISPEDLMEQDIIDLPEFDFWFSHGGSEVCHVTKISIHDEKLIFEGTSTESYCQRTNDSEFCISTDSLSQLCDVLEQSLN
ncbi:MAG TPA: hypothetical protein VGQ59_16715 [Cyclobacteriaceae bacterium]|jgi:hypothetical protein|nr:hypothetical protein [Cyclobacteriaceae bacterium]